MGGQYTRRAPPVYASGHAALELEEVVEFREDEKKTQLLIGTAQAHREPALRRPALDQHQRPKPGAVHLSCAAHVDDQAARAPRQLLQQLGGRPTGVGPRLEPPLLGRGADLPRWAGGTGPPLPYRRLPRG